MVRRAQDIEFADSSLPARPASCEIRRYESADAPDVKELLATLPLDYPGGDLWLSRRLAEALRGAATCTVAQVEGVSVGVTIETPKRYATKLSSIYVAQGYRQRGIGGILLDNVIRRALIAEPTTGIAEIYVTVAHHKWQLLERLLYSRGFTKAAVEMDRYGLGRHEVIATRLLPSNSSSNESEMQNG